MKNITRKEPKKEGLEKNPKDKGQKINYYPWKKNLRQTALEEYINT